MQKRKEKMKKSIASYWVYVLLVIFLVLGIRNLTKGDILETIICFLILIIGIIVLIVSRK